MRSKFGEYVEQGTIESSALRQTKGGFGIYRDLRLCPPLDNNGNVQLCR